MKNLITLLFFLSGSTGFSQDLLLVIDEQFANKTFDSYDDFTGQISGDLHWQTYIGGYPTMQVDLGDGGGLKNQHYYKNDDSLYFFVRDENKYTTSSGLTLEANSYPDINNLSTAANEEIGTGVTIFYPWNFRRGYFEIKAKLPAGDGIQSAFHLYGDLAVIPGFDCDNVPGDQDKNWQEIDIWETGGSGPNTLRNNIHWSAALVTPPPNENFHSCDEFCSHCQYAYRGVDCETEYDFTTDFHTIGLYWDEQYVIFLIDGDIYRYWIRVFDINPNDCNNYPDPIQTGDPRKILFTDAMTLNLGIGYGVSGKYQSGADPGNLNGPNPAEPLPESKLEVEYFRYWVFLPCENKGEVTNAAVVGNNLQIDTYQNDKTVSNYHERLYGHYETGRYVTCDTTDIGPALNGGVEAPYWYSDQLNLIASRQINLQTGFHAKAAPVNYPIDAQFHAKIQTCATIPDAQPMPWVNNMTENAGFTFLENFMGSMGNMIFESYKLSGPLRMPESDSLNADGSPELYSDYFVDNSGELLKYTLFPNPTSEKIVCKFSKDVSQTGIVIQLYNLQGSIQLETPVNGYQETIDISSLADGTYFIKILGIDQNNTFKIVKQ